MSDPSRISDAIEEIETALGEGYARAHPELIGALIVADKLGAINDSIDDVAGAIVTLSDLFESIIGTTSYGSNFLRVIDLSNEG